MTLEERLENWAAANRASGVQPGYCASWARLADIVANGVQSLPCREYDEQDAERVSRAWCRLGVIHRRLLKLLYVTNLPVPIICRRLSIRQRPMSVFDLELARAKHMIRQHLSNIDAAMVVNRAKSPYTVDDNLIPEDVSETAA